MAEPVQVVSPTMSPAIAVLLVVIILLVFWLLILTASHVNLKNQVDDRDDAGDQAARAADDAREEAHAARPRPTPHPRADATAAPEPAARTGRHAA